MAIEDSEPPTGERDLFVPDLRDEGGRLRRALIAFAISTVLAAVAYAVTTWLARDDLAATRTHGAQRFVFFFTMVAWLGGYWVVRMLLDRRASARARELPRAAARSPRP